MERRSITLTKTTPQQASDHGYVAGTMAERIAMVWELTQNAASFASQPYAESRLQRHVAVLARRES